MRTEHNLLQSARWLWEHRDSSVHFARSLVLAMDLAGELLRA